MNPTGAPSARRRVRASVVVWPLVLNLGVWAACSPAKFANGQACLKDEDCVSGICSQLVCAAAPPLTDAEPDASPEVPSGDGAVDGTIAETGAEASSEAGPEASEGSIEASSEAALDAESEATQEAAADSSTDATDD